jgi:hypothetical protein
LVPRRRLGSHRFSRDSRRLLGRLRPNLERLRGSRVRTRRRPRNRNLRRNPRTVRGPDGGFRMGAHVHARGAGRLQLPRHHGAPKREPTTASRHPSIPRRPNRISTRDGAAQATRSEQRLVSAPSHVPRERVTVVCKRPRPDRRWSAAQSSVGRRIALEAEQSDTGPQAKHGHHDCWRHGAQSNVGELAVASRKVVSVNHLAPQQIRQ